MYCKLIEDFNLPLKHFLKIVYPIRWIFSRIMLANHKIKRMKTIKILIYTNSQ